MSTTPTSSTSGPRSGILAKPLYAYTLPQQLLDILTVRSLQESLPDSVESPPSTSDNLPTRESERASVGPPPNSDPNPNSSLSCQTCGGVSFSSLEEQRGHFKSDWHRYNAKIGLGQGGKNRDILTAEEFEEVHDGLSSLSGSEDGSSAAEDDDKSDGEDDKDRITRLLRKQKLANGTANGTTVDEVDEEQEEELAEYRRRAEMRTAMIYFRPKKDIKQDLVPEDTQLGIYRALLPNQALTSSSDLLPALRSIQLPDHVPDADAGERKITLLMVAGGHFAGMVVGLRPLQTSGGKGVRPEKQEVKGAGEVRVLKHKTFHRYTTRKKQGGSQSANDNAKGKANSAGAMLRRYGEDSLREDIQALMIEWADEIQTSERIFLRSSSSGKKGFWGYPGAVLEKGDSRLKTFPFPTRRPTLSELLRCFHELTRVKVSHLSEEAIQALEEAYIASLQPKTTSRSINQQPAPQPVKHIAPKISPEEEARRDRKRRLIEMIKKGRTDPLLPFWERHHAEFGGVDAIIEEDEGETMLMMASAAGQEDTVKWLLETLKADPTKTDTAGKTAYDLGSTKGVRNVFRRLAHDHPDWHDWIGLAHVPSGLSEEKEAEQDKKRAERRKGLKEKVKEREAKRVVIEPVAEPEPPAPAPSVSSSSNKTGPQRLGGGKPGNDSMAGMTPEMRQRIERERRARAAEARLTGK